MADGGSGAPSLERRVLSLLVQNSNSAPWMRWFMRERWNRNETGHPQAHRHTPLVIRPHGRPDPLPSCIALSVWIYHHCIQLLWSRFLFRFLSWCELGFPQTWIHWSAQGPNHLKLQSHHFGIMLWPAQGLEYHAQSLVAWLGQLAVEECCLATAVGSVLALGSFLLLVSFKVSQGCAYVYVWSNIICIVCW